jgi:surfeit locus 1 family protein
MTEPERPPSVLRVLTRSHLLLLHVLAVAAVVAAYLLGQWQLGAWKEHRADTGNRLAHEAPRPLDSVLGPDDAFPKDDVGRPVELRGQWLPDRSVYVDGRLQDGRSGFWLVTPIAVCSAGASCDTASAVPVVVGWTPKASGTTPPRGRDDVVGWLQPPEQGDVVDARPEDDVFPQLRVADLLDRVDHDLYSGYVILDRPATARAGLVAVTPDSLPEAPASTALRNLLYGIQWWIFGAFAAFIWWRWCRDEVLESRGLPSSRTRAREAGSTPAPDPGRPAGEQAGEPRLPSGA